MLDGRDRDIDVGGAAAHPLFHDHNRYRFDQACRVKAIKAIKGAAELGLTQPVSINFLPNAIYKPEVCIRTTLEQGYLFAKPAFRAAATVDAVALDVRSR